MNRKRFSKKQMQSPCGEIHSDDGQTRPSSSVPRENPIATIARLSNFATKLRGSHQDKKADNWQPRAISRIGMTSRDANAVPSKA
jgi:hypothetical protein